MKTSDNINELAKALSAAQGEFTNPERDRYVKVKTKAGGEYGFWYSTLAAVKSMARPVLAKYGLSCTQPPTVRDGAVVVLTKLMHSSGQWQEEEIAVTPESLAPQQIGSGITYMRRYAYCGMLDIVSEEDDDGAAAGGHEVQEVKAKPPKPACPKCGESEFVLADREVPDRFFCWKNADKNKLGCGHKWDAGVTAEQPLPEQPKTKGKAKAVAKEHGLKTGDELPPLTTEKTPYQKALEEISKAIRNRDLDYLGKVAKAVTARTKEGVFNSTEDTGLMNAIAMAEKTIEAAKNEPVAA